MGWKRTEDMQPQVMAGAVTRNVCSVYRACSSFESSRRLGSSLLGDESSRNDVGDAGRGHVQG